MKKIVLLLSIVALGFTSCSKSDAPAAPAIPLVDPNGILPKKIITTETGSASVYTETYTYAGNKLLKVTNEDMSYETVTYTGDLITKTQLFLSDNTLDETATFEYDSNNKLIKSINLQHTNNIGTKEVYTYDSNNNATVVYSNGNLISQNNPYQTATINFFNDEVSSATVTNSGIITNYTYIYDNKNNPFKNITGFKSISFVDRPFSLFEGINKNTLTVFNGTVTYTNTYTYDGNNFPTRQTQGIETLEYLY